MGRELEILAVTLASASASREAAAWRF